MKRCNLITAFFVFFVGSCNSGGKSNIEAVFKQERASDYPMFTQAIPHPRAAEEICKYMVENNIRWVKTFNEGGQPDRAGKYDPKDDFKDCLKVGQYRCTEKDIDGVKNLYKCYTDNKLYENYYNEGYDSFKVQDGCNEYIKKFVSEKCYNFQKVYTKGNFISLGF